MAASWVAVGAQVAGEAVAGRVMGAVSEDSVRAVAAAAAAEKVAAMAAAVEAMAATEVAAVATEVAAAAMVADLVVSMEESDS